MPHSFSTVTDYSQCETQQAAGESLRLTVSVVGVLTSLSLVGSVPSLIIISDVGCGLPRL